MGRNTGRLAGLVVSLGFVLCAFAPSDGGQGRDLGTVVRRLEQLAASGRVGADSRSMDALLREGTALCNQSPRPDKRLQFRLYRAAAQCSAQEGDSSRSLSFWTVAARLAGPEDAEAVKQRIRELAPV